VVRAIRRVGTLQPLPPVAQHIIRDTPQQLWLVAARPGIHESYAKRKKDLAMRRTDMKRALEAIECPHQLLPNTQRKCLQQAWLDEWRDHPIYKHVVIEENSLWTRAADNRDSKPLNTLVVQQQLSIPTTVPQFQELFVTDNGEVYIFAEDEEQDREALFTYYFRRIAFVDPLVACNDRCCSDADDLSC
jgi:hypothetical protein